LANQVIEAIERFFSPNVPIGMLTHYADIKTAKRGLPASAFEARVFSKPSCGSAMDKSGKVRNHMTT
jgi:hypothetical protein